MNSKLTVEVAFDLPGNPPVLQLMVRKSSDTRDQIAAAFREYFGAESNWCRIHFIPQHLEGPERGYVDKAVVEPVKSGELKALAMEVISRMASPISLGRPKGFGNRVDMWCAAEHAVQIAIDFIEQMGADPGLTDSVALLAKIKEVIDAYLVKISSNVLSEDLKTLTCPPAGATIRLI